MTRSIYKYTFDYECDYDCDWGHFVDTDTILYSNLYIGNEPILRKPKLKPSKPNQIIYLFLCVQLWTFNIINTIYNQLRIK
jgi:hypothetical protein